MEEIAVVIMEKDKETGFLSKELGSYALGYDINLIQKIFAEKSDDNIIVNLYITITGEFEDWQYNAILDIYDLELYKDIVLSIEEDEESYNPGWVITYAFQDSDDKNEKKINEILGIHTNEVERVLKEIPSLEEEYRG